jgi:glucose dehydrogenase
MPGTMGGGDWGGVSFDPNLGYIFVNANNLGGVGHIVPWPDGPLPYRNDGAGVRFIDQSGYPCSATPWAQLTAVNANTGDIVWQKPVGSYDELETQGLKDTGAPGEGGSIVTAGGLVFIQRRHPQTPQHLCRMAMATGKASGRTGQRWCPLPHALRGRNSSQPRAASSSLSLQPSRLV